MFCKVIVRGETISVKSILETEAFEINVEMIPKLPAAFEMGLIMYLRRKKMEDNASRDWGREYI